MLLNNQMMTNLYGQRLQFNESGDFTTMKKIFILVAIMLVCIAPTCFAKKQTVESQNTWNYAQEIRKFADPATENMLLRFNDGNYSQYSKDFSPQMKAAMSEEKFKDAVTAVKANLGNYVSMEFANIDIRESYITVSYICKFEQGKDPVLVSSVFIQKDGTTCVDGLWLKPLKKADNTNDNTAVKDVK